MRINPKIKKILSEIAVTSVEYNNTPDEQRKYLKRMLHTFRNTLREDEQIYIMKTLSEMIHYKNIVTDPDMILSINNIKLRTYLFIFILSGCFLMLVFTLINYGSGTSSIVDFINNIVKML